MSNEKNRSNFGFNPPTESIASKIKCIEQQKLQILSNTNALFQSMDGEDMAEAEAVGETLASLIISAYRLGAAIGIQPEDMDRRIKNQVDVLNVINPVGVRSDIVALNKKFR